MSRKDKTQKRRESPWNEVVGPIGLNRRWLVINTNKNNARFSQTSSSPFKAKNCGQNPTAISLVITEPKFRSTISQASQLLCLREGENNKTRRKKDKHPHGSRSSISKYHLSINHSSNLHNRTLVLFDQSMWYREKLRIYKLILLQLL